MSLTNNATIAAAYKTKVAELGISDDFIDAYDYILITERAKQLRDKEKGVYPLSNANHLSVDKLDDFQNTVRLELLINYHKSHAQDGKAIDLNGIRRHHRKEIYG